MPKIKYFLSICMIYYFKKIGINSIYVPNAYHFKILSQFIKNFNRIYVYIFYRVLPYSLILGSILRKQFFSIANNKIGLYTSKTCEFPRSKSFYCEQNTCLYLTTLCANPFKQ